MSSKKTHPLGGGVVEEEVARVQSAISVAIDALSWERDEWPMIARMLCLHVGADRTLAILRERAENLSHHGSE